MALIDYMRELGIKRLTAGTAINNKPSVSLLRSLGFELIETEKVSFYKDADGNDILFDGGIFELRVSQIPEYREIAFFHHLLLKKFRLTEKK